MPKSQTRPQNFKQFLLMSCDSPEFGGFARQATSDRNWAGVSAQSLRNHLKSINAPVEAIDALSEAEQAWEKLRGEAN